MTTSQGRTRTVTAAQVRAYLNKAEEYLAASNAELEAERSIAATSAAIHAAINAADVVTGHRMGHRSAGRDHSQVLPLLQQAGKDGAELAKNLARLLALKTRAEYSPDAVAMPEARRAVERASRCVAIARRVAVPT